MDTGEFWDGGLGFPNPVELARWESTRIWGNTAPDILISIGTGVEARKQKPVHSRSVHRLWHSFMDLLDGESHFQNTKNGFNKDHKQDLFRLNVKLDNSTRLDDVSNLRLLRENVHLRPHSHEDLIEVAIALLISNFYFELDASPVYNFGIYYCHGSIRCRTDCYAVIDALKKLCFSRIEYVAENEIIAKSELHDDICPICKRYTKKMTLRVRHPTDLVTLYFRSKGTFSNENTMIRRISGFPQTISWFEEQQGFTCSFGTSDHDKSGSLPCCACRDPLKRKKFPIESSSRKRVRVSIEL
jgi:hypothetical protein